MRGRRLAVRRLVPGRPSSCLPMSSAGLKLVCAMWRQCGIRRSLMTSPSGRLAACPNQQSLLCTSSARLLVRPRRRRRSTDGAQFPRLTRRMRRLLLLSRNSNILSLASRTGHVSQPLSKIERTTAWLALPFVHNNISRRDQNSKREYAEQARLILLLISSVNWPLTVFCREKRSC